ncbi:TonB family protein [Pseudoalteromonas sp. 3J6]|uniref:energy transducer TonB n=1 Tax=Pseudoalteromonas sp. 3J6 TaxID=649161 RepID=UPI00174FE08E|nr:energy transducer TonB [Pseudoalteromonas sp. 3J6]CAD2226270.1 TonB family protein [Pseudoalteromonas sp. 3J6]
MKGTILKLSVWAWLGALLLAALVHLILFFLIFYSPSVVQQNSTQASANLGVEISLGPQHIEKSDLTSSSVSAANKDKIELKSEPKVERKPELKPEPKEPKAERKPKLKPEPKPQPKAERKPKLKPEPKPQPKAERKPKLKPEPKPQEKPVQATESANLAIKAESIVSSNKKVTMNNQSTSLNKEAINTSFAYKKNYAATLLTWLEKHKEYPRMARSRRQQGTVIVYFIVDRDGIIITSRIEQTSGYSALDDEALKMLARAQPLPGIPNDIEGNSLELVVPVEFFIR